MNNMKKWNFVISGLTAIIGIIIIGLSSRLSLKFTSNGPGAGFWPMLLGILLVLMAVLLLGTTFVKGSDLEKISVVLNAAANKRVYIVMGIIVIYGIVLRILGFYITTALFIPAVMYLMDERDKKKLILTSVITVIAIYVIFGMILSTRLPLPVFMS